MTLGLTDPARDRAAFDRYAAWVNHWVPDVQIRRLSYDDQNSNVQDCDGLLLTGGGDVHPRLYGREDALEFVNEINERRDEFEIRIIENALKERIPTLGICRGTQIVNVALGGTLIPDIEREGFPSHRKTAAGDRMHSVEIVPGSLLDSIVRTNTVEVNSSHHQSVDSLGKGLRICARSTDGIIEGLEWEEATGRAFLLLVQWHPERMTATASPCAKNIIFRFAGEMRLFSERT